MNVIQTEGLTKFYGRSRGILDLDLEVREGEFFGFIGPNGAGKSTTIRILMGLIRKTQGSVWMLGMDILKEKKKFSPRPVIFLQRLFSIRICEAGI